MPSDLPISVLVLDVDGVLTDGGIYVDEDGREFKRFDVTDGFGIRLWALMGGETAIITGRAGDTVRHRAAYLGIKHVHLDCKDKHAAMKLLARDTGVDLSRMAFLGDDWPDLAAMRVAGYPMAVANADARVKQAARRVMTRRGGDGAVREAVEHLLSQAGLLDAAILKYDPGYRAT